MTRRRLHPVAGIAVALLAGIGLWLVLIGLAAWLFRW